MLEEIFNVQELTEYLKMNPRTLQRKARKGEIPTIKIGRQYRFDKEQIERWLSQQSIRKPLNILVVDDEQDVTKLVKRTLEDAGYIVSVANEGNSVLAMLAEREPDLVLLGVKIPGLDGYRVLERIQESSDVPVLMLTAVHEKAAMAHSLGIGADDFIEKSFLPRVFVARIRAKLRRASGELRTHQMHNIDGLYVRPGAFSAIETERRDHGDTRYPE